MLEELVGATITRVQTRQDDYSGDWFVRLRLKYADNVEVNGQREGYYEIWRDEEGNGPGELVFLGGAPDE